MTVATDPPPLAGFTVGVTGARRADELAALLERRGARVVHGPALRFLPLADDTALHRVTGQCVDRPPDVVVATTGIGFRGWLEAAECWGMGTALLNSLRQARLLARGPKARGAVRAAGLPDPWSPQSESSGELLEHLFGESIQGMRLAVQLHGRPLPGFVDALDRAGAEVIEVPVYRWGRPTDPAPLTTLLDSVCAHALDAVTFTSAPAAANLLAVARERGRYEELVAALQESVLCACVGPVTHAPLHEVGIPALLPARFRLGAMVRTLCETLPSTSPSVPAADHELQVRGHAAIVDGAVKPLSPQALALLRTLIGRPGQVISRRELALSLPDTAAGPSSEHHAVEQAIARLRSALGTPELVQTVIKRGYRLAPDNAASTPQHAEVET